MKTKFLELLIALLFIASAPALLADSLITATVTVTTPSNIVDTLASITVNSDTRVWSTNAATASTINIPSPLTITKARSNLLSALYLTPFSSVLLQSSGTNALTLRGSAVNVIIANGWASVSYVTNTIGQASSIRAPASVATLSELTNSESAIAFYLGDIYGTNTVPTNAPALSPWWQWINTHSTGGTNIYNTTNIYQTNVTFNISGGTNTVNGGTNTITGVNTINNFSTNIFDVTTNTYPTNIINGGVNTVTGGTTILNGTNYITQTNTYYTVTNQWFTQLNAATNGQVFIATGPTSGYWTNSSGVVGGGGASLSDITNVVNWLTVSNSAAQQFTNVANVFMANGYNWGQNIAAPANTSTVRWFAVTNAGQVWAIPAAAWP